MPSDLHQFASRLLPRSSGAGTESVAASHGALRPTLLRVPACSPPQAHPVLDTRFARHRLQAPARAMPTTQLSDDLRFQPVHVTRCPCGPVPLRGEQ